MSLLFFMCRDQMERKIKPRVWKDGIGKPIPVDPKGEVSHASS